MCVCVCVCGGGGGEIYTDRRFSGRMMGHPLASRAGGREERGEERGGCRESCVVRGGGDAPGWLVVRACAVGPISRHHRRRLLFPNAYPEI